MTKKSYLEALKKCPGLLHFPLLFGYYIFSCKVGYIFFNFLWQHLPFPFNSDKAGFFEARLFISPAALNMDGCEVPDVIKFNARLSKLSHTDGRK